MTDLPDRRLLLVHALPGTATKAALCAVAAATTTALLSACSFTPETGEESYSVTKPVTSLRIDNQAGSIQVVPGSGKTVSVVETYEYGDHKPWTRHSVTDGELVLTNPGCGKRALVCRVSYRVEVPASTATHLTIGAGGIQVRGLSGTTYAKAEAGTVKVADSSARTLTAIADGGNVTASFKALPDRVDANAAAGNVTVRLPEGVYDVDPRTEAGGRSVSVQTDSASPHKIKAHTEAGDVSVEYAG